ncbi:MAG TPA: hypothetical protein VLE53_11925 [Gemmatimonadaceae bacterium]|nr:hypothetical protein [Gemmatimonadaceae bacterium]
MSATLPLARAAFLSAVSRDTIQTERTRLLAVLDAMIAWSDAHPGLVRFRADPNEKGVVRFECADSKAIFWAATPRRHDAPVLELLPGASRFLTDEERASAMSTLNAHTREDLDPAGRLHISFGALKNAAAQAAIFELMDGLLAKTQLTNGGAVKVS